MKNLDYNIFIPEDDFKPYIIVSKDSKAYANSIVKIIINPIAGKAVYPDNIITNYPTITYFLRFNYSSRQILSELYSNDNSDVLHYKDTSLVVRKDGFCIPCKIHGSRRLFNDTSGYLFFNNANTDKYGVAVRVCVEEIKANDLITELDKYLIDRFELADKEVKKKIKNRFELMDI